MNVTCIKLIYKSLRRVLYHSLGKNDVVDFLVVTSIDEFTGEFGQVEPVHLRYLRADEKLNKNKTKCCKHDGFDVSFRTALSPVLIHSSTSQFGIRQRMQLVAIVAHFEPKPVLHLANLFARRGEAKIRNSETWLAQFTIAKKNGGCRFYHNALRSEIV